VSKAPGAAASVPYRADIDGLRAICVVSVILFHFGVPGFSGGYVGVDVFFVVSGYLITLLLIAPSDATFAQRAQEFYVRRGRRILPALLFVLAASAAVAAVLFFPADLWRFGRSLVFATAMLGNIGAWIDGGYFELGERFAPLQHLWSIGVEEQFYLGYPLVLLLLSSYLPRFRSATIVALTLLSFLLCIFASYHHPSANYYWLPTRAWQLLCGALVALGVVPAIGNRIASETLAIASLALLALTIHLYGPATPYPGLYAIAPSAAAVLLIATATTRPTLVSRLLSVGPLVFTGLISYSLYLWHAPILAFFVYYNIAVPGPIALVGLLIVIYLLGVVGWAAIEKPIRSKRMLQSNRSFVAATLAVTFVSGVFGGLLLLSRGLPQRFAGEEIATLAAGADDFPLMEQCANIALERVARGELCSYGPPDDSLAKVVVWGDSHAYALLPTYEALAASHRIRLYYGIMGACRPLLRARVDESEWRQRRCAQFNAAMIRAIERLDPQAVVLNAYWIDRDTNLPGSNAAVPDDPDFLASLERVLTQVDSGKRSVCAVLTVPSHEYPVPYALAMARRRGLNEDFLVVTRAEALEQYEYVERDMRLLERQGQLRVADPKDVLCPANECLLQGSDSKPLYRDRHHLSMTGGAYVSNVIETCLQDLGL
jgi:peptidoglycan/LPS O-acetylase OafA/YrhL